ncbi:transcriptional adapter 2-beta-like isoform X2 [Tubulanus polymorphus]|uniref:transcriptional adapter 2-beta-like isoform X2 n=1 Tax=Tubulanus polymorphus TaxID=672921 RepID=UPI003DA4B720
MNDWRMTKNYCTYCQNLVEGVRIRCAECPDIDLCLPCYACGAEFGSHKKDHDYIVLDNLDFPIYGVSINWTAGEELLLLDSVEQYGFGNWNDISSHVETKSAEECKNHYIALYIHGNIGQVTFPDSFKARIVDHTAEPGFSPPSHNQPIPPADLTVQEQHELGYMPYRDDFERDYDNAAESEISGLCLHHEDDEIDTVFKLAQVDKYRQRLKERQRRKTIAREHGLLSQFFQNRQQTTKITKKKPGKEDLHQRLQVFSQVLSTAEREQYFENLDKEKLIKQKIKELQKYRRNGITKLEDCHEYDVERCMRDKKKDTTNKKKMVCNGSLNGNYETHINGFKKSRKRRKRKLFFTKRKRKSKKRNAACS